MQDYNEILENMKDKYFEIRGSDPDEECDSGILLRLMAGEVYSLEAYADWLKAAMFVSSAHGEALDHHAEKQAVRHLVRFVFQWMFLLNMMSLYHRELCLLRATDSCITKVFHRHLF